MPVVINLPPLGPSGAYLLDDPSELSCQDSTQGHAVDDPLLSPKQPVGVRVPQGAAVGVGGGRWRCSPVRCVGGSARPSSVLRVQGVGDGRGDLGMGEVVLDGVFVGAGVGDGELLAKPTSPGQR